MREMFRSIKANQSRWLKLLSLVSMLPWYGNAGQDECLWLLLDGQNVCQTWSPGSELNQCLWYTAQWGQYFLWQRSWEMSGNYGTISFTAKATNDIHVGVSIIDPWASTPTGDFYAQLTNASNFYEIVIGGWANSTSAIRKGSQTEPLKTSSRGVPKDKDTSVAFDQPMQYKVIFYHDDQSGRDMIAVYCFDPGVSEWSKIISYRDPSFITASKRWISLTNWDNNIFYTDINVSTSTELPTNV